MKFFNTITEQDISEDELEMRLIHKVDRYNKK